MLKNLLESSSRYLTALSFSGQLSDFEGTHRHAVHGTRSLKFLQDAYVILLDLQIFN